MNLPNFSFEKKLWKKGFKFVAGADEVGRGCFAGPVVAGCVVFMPQISKSQFQIPNQTRIDDSKKLSPRQREISAKWIKKNALTWGIGESNVALINRVGMGKATRVAFRRAVKVANSKLKINNLKLDYLLLDAFYIPFVRDLPKPRGKKLKGTKTIKDGLSLLASNTKQLAIIDGDAKSISIAAASIIAKVYRDKLMLRLSRKSKYKKYAWAKNKGYGTKEHQEAIKKFGVTRYHRKRFIQTFLKKLNLPLTVL